METIEVATIITSSSDHTNIIPISDDNVYDESFFYSNEGRPSECFSFCRFQVNIGIYEDSYRWMQKEGLDEREYLHKYGKDFSTFALITNSNVPYLRILPEYRGCSYPAGRAPYVSPENEYSKMSTSERNEKYPKIAWGMAAVFIWDLLYDNAKEDFVLLCEDQVLMTAYYNAILRTYLQKHNTRKYKHLSPVEKEQMFLEEYIIKETELWNRSKPSLANYKTIFNYTEDYMNEYLKFLKTKYDTMTEAQQKNDEKYVRLLMHYMNVYVMQNYFNRGPQRIDHRIVDIFDYWTNILGSPDFKIYDVSLSNAIMKFYDSWHTLMQSAGIYYNQSQTPTDYVFGEGRAEFDFFKSKDEEDFFEKLVSLFPVWANLFSDMIEAIKDRYVIDFDDIDSTLCNPRVQNKQEMQEVTIVEEFNDCDVYVSYPWTDSDMMDEICRCLKKRKINYYRDKEMCGYRKNIQSFEEEIGDGKIVIAIINERSLKSIDCMYEVCTLASNGHIEKRLFPIVDLPNMSRDSKACEEYLKTWEEKEKDIITRYSMTSGDKVNELRELKYINCIKAEFPKLWSYISRHNTLDVDLLRKDDWKVLIDEVELNLK